MRKNFHYFLIIFLSIYLTGCWDYKEINDTTMMNGMFINTDKDIYNLYFEALSSDPDSKKILSNIVETKSPTIFSAVRKFVEKYGKVGYWSHAKVMLIDSNYAKEDICQLLDYTIRDAEYRSDMELIISDNIESHDLFNLTQIDKPTFTLIDDILQNQIKTGTFVQRSVWDFVDSLTQKGIEPIAPLLHINKCDSPYHTNEITINGIAVFKGSQMLGTLSGDETLYLLFITDDIKNYYLSIPFFPKSTDGIGFPITFEISKSKTKVTPSKINNDLCVNIDIKCEVELAELGTEEDYIKDRKILEEFASSYLEENIKILIYKLQNEYDSDIFGFGLAFKRDKPKIWKNVENSWDYEFSHLKINVKADVNITESALIFKPVKNNAY